MVEVVTARLLQRSEQPAEAEVRLREAASCRKVFGRRNRRGVFEKSGSLSNLKQRTTLGLSICNGNYDWQRRCRLGGPGVQLWLGGPGGSVRAAGSEGRYKLRSGMSDGELSNKQRGNKLSGGGDPCWLVPRAGSSRKSGCCRDTARLAGMSDDSVCRQ